MLFGVYIKLKGNTMETLKERLRRYEAVAEVFKNDTDKRGMELHQQYVGKVHLLRELIYQGWE